MCRSWMSTKQSSPVSAGVATIPDGVPKLTLGWQVAEWASSMLVHPNGPRAGKEWEFTLSQVRFLLWWYAVDEDGRWLFMRGVRRLPKGSGKSPFAAVLALAEFVGPVRLKDFDSSVDGGCVGERVTMPLVQIAATAESQTKNTMRQVRAMAHKESRIAAQYSLDPGKTKIFVPPEGELEVITSSFAAAEGAETTFCVGDETEHWTPSNGAEMLMETIEDNLAKSGSRMVETCNAWVPDGRSQAELSWDAFLAQQEGRLKDEASRILYDARIAPDDLDIYDVESLRAGLEFVYDDCYWIDVDTIIGKILNPKTPLDASRRKYLNRPSVDERAWVKPEEWGALADTSKVVADGDEICLFFDGSKSRDATALIGCRIEDGHVFTLGVWEPNLSADDTVDVGDVDLTVRRAFERYDVAAFFADVKEWDSYVKTEWPERYRDQLSVWAQPSSRPSEPIAWDMRAKKYEFASAAESCQEDIVGGMFTHDGDSRVARHVGNARRRAYRDKFSIGKESADSPKKIDAAVCVIGVRMVRRMVLADPKRGKQKQRTGRYW